MKVAIGQLEKPLATTIPNFNLGDHTLQKTSVTKILTWPIIQLHIMRYNSVVNDTTHGLHLFPHSTKRVKSTASEKSGKSIHVVFIDDALTKPPMTMKTIRAFFDHPSEWNTTGTVTPLKKNRGSSESANFSFNVNNICQKSSNQTT